MVTGSVIVEGEVVTTDTVVGVIPGSLEYLRVLIDIG